MKKVLVIFDCFGVLCERVSSVFLSRHCDKETINRLEKTLIIDGDMGKLTRAEFMSALSNETGLSVDEIEKEYKSLSIPHDKLYPIIEKIREFADVALLSNAFFGHAEMIIDGLGIRRLFDKLVLSCNEKMIKPDPKFYELCRDSFGKEYDEVYMVDDTDANLVPLADIGIIPIKYIDHTSVETALKKYF